MALVLICGVTGWMLGLDAFWGDRMVEAVHLWAANAILFLLIFHVGGAIVGSVRHTRPKLLACSAVPCLKTQVGSCLER